MFVAHKCGHEFPEDRGSLRFRGRIGRNCEMTEENNAVHLPPK